MAMDEFMLDYVAGLVADDLLDLIEEKYNPRYARQPRDRHGRWTSGPLARLVGPTLVGMSDHDPRRGQEPTLNKPDPKPKAPPKKQPTAGGGAGSGAQMPGAGAGVHKPVTEAGGSGPTGQTTAVTAKWDRDPDHLTDGLPEDGKARSFLERGKKVSNFEASAAKSEIALQLTNRIMNDPALVKRMEEAGYGGMTRISAHNAVVQDVNQWANTSGDTHPMALSMQMAVAEEFGLTHAKNFLTKNENWSLSGAERVFKNEGAKQRVVARAMYEHTQAELKKAGIKEVTLHRGMVVDKGAIKEGKAEVAMNPVSSWSVSKQTAESFAYGDFGYPEKQSPVLMSAKVPASHVLGTARTGFGCLGEAEFVVMAPAAGTKAGVRTVELTEGELENFFYTP